ncbi:MULTISPECIES: sensor domain-containing diguanylate cyclase [Saccharibacillus]|uniref:sensor domain-containing diguanylate cyclase n=1 Tax=Saccharibacillus TaxID=456492 RepID=UPI0012398599|nr:sensor domain-containing diguanylate cyclase [Saccharibacillus sp. WB 17]MWJ31515.1 diguanylate cyclase [Saccharibacillus sp. WB 17]
MDSHLDRVPGGYFSISESGFVQSVNRNFLDMLGLGSAEELVGQHLESVLSITNKMFFHTYFYPQIQLYGRVDEMYFSFRAADKQKVPVLLNAMRREQGGEVTIDCIALLMRKRLEYEKDTLRSKRELEDLYTETRALNGRLETLHAEYERKQQELMEMNDRLETLASTDPLTGLHNRRFFQSCLRSEWTGSLNGGGSLSLLILDIDHFKKINDTYGHPVGDFVLTELARLLREQSGPQDICARFGGEEFVVLLPGRGRSEAVAAAEHIRGLIEATAFGPHRITVSIGVETTAAGSAESGSAEDGETEDSLLDRADLALYASKTGGRNRVTHARDLPPGA